MMIRIVGASLLCLASVYIGFSAAGTVRKTAKELQRLKLALEMMHCEVSYALTPLGRVCEIISDACGGDVGRFFYQVQKNLAQSNDKPQDWVAQTVCKFLPSLPKQVQDALTELLSSFGRFGVHEQLRMIDLAAQKVDAAISDIDADRAQRCKCYRTLGICTGIAVAVLVL